MVEGALAQHCAIEPPSTTGSITREANTTYTTDVMNSSDIVDTVLHVPVASQSTRGIFWRYLMLSIFRKLMKNDDGATAIEYVLIASLISVAAIAAMGTVGGKVSNVLSNVANAMT